MNDNANENKKIPTDDTAEIIDTVNEADDSSEQNTESTPAEPSPEKSEETVSKTKRTLGEIVECLEIAVCAIVAVVLIFAAGFRICFVNGTSMNKTLNHQDWVLVSNIGYEPQCGDIIVFHMTSDKYARLNEPMVKRVIAVSGQWIDIDFDTWTLRIADNPEMENATVVDEPYRYLDTTKQTLKSTHTFPLEIPEGYIFVMGDNRNNSLDSRNAEQIGLVDTRRVLGKVILRVYPFKSIEN